MLRDLSDTVAFVKVVKEGSFTAAAKALTVPKTRISRKVQELEERLGAKLLNRTTRTMKLTEAGSIYYQQCEALISGVEDAEAAIAELQQHPRGWLKISAPHWLTTGILAPVLIEFKRFYPEIYPQLFLGAEVTDIIAKDMDVAIRIWNGPMPDSSLTARRLGSMPTGLYAAPSYLDQHGEPAYPLELKEHACLVSQLYMGREEPCWPLISGGERKDYSIRPVAAATDPEGLHGFLLAGQGIQLTNHMRVAADVEAGRLKRVLPDWTGPEPGVYAIRTGGRLVPPRLRVFLDFLQPRIDFSD